ncbi:hypothetical protein SRABI118_00390 [Massilia sp. Bi118]|uniref:hypothetical protein n=1 Tax=Massilia sp. Bi118 TaxID=2822346 RepID=UPI001DC39CD9|nr:hypothetical protein [Massilia sp. Bi118]CAH0145305.1 hypothetical protein SRABI118_00390 [Massilia sp. Bi118]
MRALSIFLAAAVLLTTASTAQADAGSTPASRATAEQMEQITGAYKLSDGRRADIFLLGTRLYVKIGRGQQKELLLAGPNRFASADGKLAIQFGPDLANDRIVLEHDRGILRQDTIRLAASERPGRGAAD